MLKRKIEVRVKSYPNKKIRSYFPDKQFVSENLTLHSLGMCNQDGIIFQGENPDNSFGIVTLDDAIKSASFSKKVGLYGCRILGTIARSRLKNNLIKGSFTSNFQLDIEFRDVPFEKVDRLMSRAFSGAFNVKVEIKPY